MLKSDYVKKIESNFVCVIFKLRKWPVNTAFYDSNNPSEDNSYSFNRPQEDGKLSHLS